MVLLASAALAMLLLASAFGDRPAGAAFPGKNGKIAFVSTRDGDEEIYVIEADGTNETRLTTEPGRDIHPMFSPDGKRVTFTRRPLSGIADETIYVMDPADVDPVDGDGDNIVMLTPATPPNFMSAYSPDGSRLVFMRQEGGDNEIWSMNADGTNPVRLTDNSQNEGRPVFSPDGTKIVFSRRDPNAADLSLRRLDIYVMNADGTDQTRLTSTTANESNPRFSPNGEKLAFDKATPPGTADLYLMNPDGTDQTRLTSDPGSEEFPAFSPDGEQLAFASDRDGNLEVYVMDLDNPADPVRLTETDPPVENTRVEWGPYLYDFAGFFQPVDNPPSLNSVKPGRAIPVKFSLGGNQGLDIFAAGYPQSQQIDCESTVPVGIPEQTVTTGGSGLSYDAATGEYSYVWKTEKAWKGTCRELVVKLDDSTFHRANFRYK